jgi:transglutaminase-like putative cysteine protease
VELVESPWQLYLRRASDCDGWASLFAAAAGAIGFPYRFVTIAADPSRPNDPSHVFTEVYVQDLKTKRGQWVGADLTVDKEFGWEPPRKYKRTYWPEPKY